MHYLSLHLSTAIYLAKETESFIEDLIAAVYIKELKIMRHLVVDNSNEVWNATVELTLAILIYFLKV